MEYVRIGNSGLKLTQITFGSALTIGTENLAQSFSDELISKAWELGIRSFDTSNNYGFGEAERLVAKSLKHYPRDEYVISTKGSWQIGESPYHKGLSRKHILWAAEESLKRMELDYVDLYYAHRYYDDVSMEEIVRTFNYLINKGLIRYWATSEWPVHALEKCHEVCDRLVLEKPVLEQSFYSYAVQKVSTNGVKDFCMKHGVGMLGFGVLAQGLLTGKYKDGIPEDSRIAKSEKINYSKTADIYNQNRETITLFLKICEKYGVKPVAAALGWSIRNRIYPVLGASRPKQLEESILALESDIPEGFWKELGETSHI